MSLFLFLNFSNNILCFVFEGNKRVFIELFENFFCDSDFVSDFALERSNQPNELFVSLVYALLMRNYVIFEFEKDFGRRSGFDFTYLVNLS